MRIKTVFPTKISKEQARDTGMAIALILLLVGLFQKDLFPVKIAVVALIITMTIPLLFKYIAVIWFGLSRLLGTVVSRILLTIIFFLVVAPMGLMRRILGYDSLKLKEFKKGIGSVMQVRNITFSKNDIDKPF